MTKILLVSKKSTTFAIKSIIIWHYMVAEIKNILYDLLRTSSPSGYEEQAIGLFTKFIAPYVDGIYTDIMGNCIAHKKGNGKKILLMAHADEIGLIISHIDEKGFLYFKEIGGLDTNILPGQRVSINGKNERIVGVIGKKPVHLQDQSENTKDIKSEDLWIDIAASNKKEATEAVQLGSIATIISDPVIMSNSLVSSKSLDDKIGLVTLIGVAQNFYESDNDYDIYFVASVQEELGARGAQTVTERIMPEIGIIIDVTHATDYPTMSLIKDGDIKLGEGVVISLGPNMNKEVAQDLMNIATSNNIKHQIEIIAHPTGTDARMVQVAGSGVKTGLISIPCRYMHTPNEVVSLRDADNAITLLTKFLQNSDN